MKAIRISILTAVSFLAAATLPVRASVAVVSNLPESGQASAGLRSSDGSLLPSGCLVRLATFPGKSAEQIAALAGSGVPALLAAASFFGEASSIGTGNAGSGYVEFLTEGPLAEALAGLHVIIANPAATEALVLRLPLVLPADDLAGPAAHLSVHLEDTTVVYGQRTAAGFLTAVTPSSSQGGYQAWILDELGGETPEADLEPDADADRDGLANLMEYALGSLAGDGSSTGRVILRRSPEGEFFIQYLRRTDDPHLVYGAEGADGGGLDLWAPLAGAPVAPLQPPSPAPSFFEWVEQPLPSGASGFARLRVGFLEGNP